MSEREKALAKVLKPGKKFSAQENGTQSSGLSIHEKASSAKVPP
jgi:hypothetical protein